MNRARLRNAARIVLIVLLAWAIFQLGSFDLDQLTWILSRPSEIVLALICIWGSQLFAARRLQIILDRQALSYRFWNILIVTSAAQFASNLLLGIVGGDGVKLAYFAMRDSAHTVRVVVALVLDHLLGLFALVLIGLTALALHHDLVRNSAFLRSVAVAGFAVVMVVAAISVAAWLILGRSRLAKTFGSTRYYFLPSTVVESVGLVCANPILACRGLVLSICANALPLVGFYVLVADLPGIRLSASEFAFVLPTAQLANSLSITPGGLGVGESVFDLLSRLVTGGQGLSFGALFFSFRLISALASLPGIFPVVFASSVRERKSDSGPSR
jgi:uncharacterized membrane protein YbhN (UPF0104 family)